MKKKKKGKAIDVFWFLFSIALFILFLFFVKEFGNLTLTLYIVICVFAFVKLKTIKNPWIPGLVAFGFFLTNVAFASLFPLINENLNKDLASIITAIVIVIFLGVIYQGSKKLKRT